VDAEQAQGRMSAAVPVGTAGTAVTVVAHRGVADRAPENILPALRRALAVGADAAELPVLGELGRRPVPFHVLLLPPLRLRLSCVVLRPPRR
jgi:hypothetical protein